MPNYYTFNEEGYKELAKYVGIFSSIHYILNDDVAATNRIYSSSQIVNRINSLDTVMSFATLKPVNNRANMKSNNSYIMLDTTNITDQEITLNVPRVESPVELHLFIVDKDVNFKFPVCRWQNKVRPVVKAGYIYELIFSYVDPLIGWLACFNEYKIG